MATILKNKSILIIGFAEVTTNIGNWITMMSIYAILIFRNDGSTAESSGIFLAGMLPMMLVSPLAGQLVDKYDRKKLMMASEFFSGLAVAMIILTHQIVFIYVFLALQACSMSILGPARSAAIPSLVDKEDLTQVNAFFQQLVGIVKIAGPIIGGMLLTIMDPYHALILDVTTFVLSIIILSQLPSLLPAATEKDNLETSAAEDSKTEQTISKTLRNTPMLLLLFVIMFFAIMVVMSFDILSSIMTRDVLQGDESLFGILVAAVGLGTIVASVALMADKKETTVLRAWYGAILGMVFVGVIPFTLAISTQIPSLSLVHLVVIIGMFLGGIGNGLSIIQVSTLLQLLSPAELLGRISGVFQMVIVGGQLITVVALPFIVPTLITTDVFFTIATLIIIILLAITITMVQKYHSQPKHELVATEG